MCRWCKMLYFPIEVHHACHFVPCMTLHKTVWFIFWCLLTCSTTPPGIQMHSCTKVNFRYYRLPSLAYFVKNVHSILYILFIFQVVSQTIPQNRARNHNPFLMAGTPPPPQSSMDVFTILHIWWFNLTNKDILNVCLMTNMDPRFFLISSLWCNQTGDYPQDNLAKSGYRENMKVENLKNLFMFWLPAWTWCRYLVIF